MNDPIPLRPQPSIPNPFVWSPYMEMSDEEIEKGIEAAGYRIEAAMHTREALIRERERRVAASTNGGN